MFLVYLHGISIILTILLPLLVAGLCRARFGGSWTPLWVTLALQGVFYGFLSHYVWSNFPGSAAIIGIGAAALIVAYSAVFGILVFPIVYLLLTRPPRWGRYLRRFIVGYALGVLALASPRLITMSGLTTNVDLYGQVVDIDGQPVAGASVELAHCGYFRENPLRTDDDGRFHVIATCGRNLTIARIFNPETQSYCLPRGKSDEYLLWIYEDPDHARLWKTGKLWEHRLRENPLRLECAWHVPEGLRAYRARAQGEEVVPDGRPYHIAPVTEGRRRGLQIVEGSPASGLEFRVFVDDRAALLEDKPTAGRLEIVFNGGQVQEYAGSYALRADGYGDKITVSVDDIRRQTNEGFSFHNPDSAHYGLVDISFGARKFKGAIYMSVKVFMDLDGSRIVLTGWAQHERKQIDDLPF